MPYRILVHNKDKAVAWYRDQLAFTVLEEWGPAFAILAKGSDQLWVSGPQTSAAKEMPDGRIPSPGGWNRIVVEVEDLETLVSRLQESGVVFRNEPVAGPGGIQVLIEDPCGNLVELFQALSRV
jgi:catechol 2,3-dioxygenase-like lactoylglutathione lyase family enzyme